MEFDLGVFAESAFIDLVDLLGQNSLGVIFGRTCFELFPFVLDGDDCVVEITFLLDAAFQGGPRPFSVLFFPVCIGASRNFPTFLQGNAFSAEYLYKYIILLHNMIFLSSGLAKNDLRCARSTVINFY